MSGEVLERLARLLREEGGLMATLVADPRALADRDEGPGSDGSDAIGNTVAPRIDRGDGPGGESPGRVAAAGPRAEGRREEYELLVEAIYEGYLLHYGAPRVVRPKEADLGLLAGDRLYAFGLCRLVELEDAAAVGELADTITLSALAQGSGDRALAHAVWMAGARAVGWGSSAAHRRAKDLLLAGSPGAIEAMRTSAEGSPATP
jgi:hypothetical protein